MTLLDLIFDFQVSYKLGLQFLHLKLQRRVVAFKLHQLRLVYSRFTLIVLVDDAKLLFKTDSLSLLVIALVQDIHCFLLLNIESLHKFAVHLFHFVFLTGDCLLVLTGNLTYLFFLNLL